MGKKGRKTRWRTLTIADEHSDSEESNTTTSGHRVPKGYPQKSYYSRFTYSSQSTPTRRYQCDGTKSTRSSSTASENKITFNEDEYTRITTPRQDVLFKKGYLNKPKTYQTQTSTGNSTTSTGNSTGNGTPDHQSTDLEYESQFVFPNGFVDQNGIYYVNSFEPYPLMVFSPPTYYPEFTSVKSKRCSTSSLTESTSPNNEEASQDVSHSETPSNISDFSHVYNVIYPGFYYNGACQPQDAASQPEPRRMKKKRRRKLSRSKSLQDGTTDEYTDESSDEVFSDKTEESEEAQNPEEKKVDAQKLLLDSLGKENSDKESTAEEIEEKKESTAVETEEKKESTAGETEEKKESTVEETEEKKESTADETEDKKETKQKYDLKPDAEEFVPRAYRHPETIPMEANVQFIKIPPNFVPLHILNPLADFNAFIPPGIPINFVPQNYVNFIPNYVNKTENHHVQKQEKVQEEIKETVDVPKNQIDIAKIVSKLEEAAKEQDETTEKKNEEVSDSPKRKTPLKRSKVDKTVPETKDLSKNNSPKKEVPIPRPIRNYSDLLKKPPMVPNQQCERHARHMERQTTHKQSSKEILVKNHVRNDQNLPKTPNQWISVSNRKKRKNKNVEETDDFEVEEPDKDLFENYDLKELVDVIPTPPPMPPTSPPPPREEPEVVQKTETLVVVEEPIKEELKEEKKKAVTKKKSKKPPKVPVRRVIIKDVDLSQEVPKIIQETIEPVVVPEEEKKIEVVEDKSPEKKTKKKKKKVAKAPVTSESSSTATSNLVDDSYDFLLESSLLEESQEKTNIEVSQELDKMIQRGMYSNLEEKIKCLNIDSSDNFFKSFMENISSREPSVEKSFSKSPDYAKLLNGGPLLMPKSMPADPITGDFLGESTPTTVGGPDKPSQDDLYPITKAVKEWMTKTREITPDVEILKSPSTIFREFGELPKNGDGNSLSAGLSDGESADDEVTVYSLGREGSADLPDDAKTAPSSIEEGEDVLEIYDSKYGKNEDFLKIRREVDEKKTSSYPKHGNLPYRAICCSIM